jgi:hypothetical protein
MVRAASLSRYVVDARFRLATRDGQLSSAKTHRRRLRPRRVAGSLAPTTARRLTRATTAGCTGSPSRSIMGAAQTRTFGARCWRSCTSDH